jgi:hypothetical protein
MSKIDAKCAEIHRKLTPKRYKEENGIVSVFHQFKEGNKIKRHL